MHVFYVSSTTDGLVAWRSSTVRVWLLGVTVAYQTGDREVAGSTVTRCTTR